MFRVPVSWTMCATIEVRADSLLEAVETAYALGTLPDGEYLEGSFVVHSDEVEEL